MALTCLPAWPFLLFGIIEPALLIWALVSIYNDPNDFYVRQHYEASLQQVLLTPQALVLVLQTGNIFLLLAGLAVICSWTTHAEVAKRYLFVVAIADLGHIWGNYKGLGDQYFWEFAQWNDLIWGSVGVSAFLNINRWATLVGLFGRVGPSSSTAKKRN
ncbi:uncharacterized protein HMPREF1541_00616 [Cyphellophora europaea CBS 101466]|uniref:DUF7704 domain-containing protein n=1 Tax=Cyphellophora europaea (strain CBS 101466) TaxID=1220924 RepID=W2SCM1_CYPE1|nr:uncharacterized protein HMPREF1541_00616 [Cyphellophora europaea CBS 101466]ETN46432.1 hypothetical protein HMPREF1541_00616 [Cyphellophora europaea CBS 101466]